MGWRFPLTYIPDGAVTTAKLAADAVTAANIADNAVVQRTIAAAAVGTPQLADSSVATAKLVDQAVAAGKIALLAVGTTQMALGAVGTSQLADLAVATGKIALAAVGTTQLANGAATSAIIADAAVITQKLADAAVATAKIANGSVTTTKIANASITNALIANLAVGTANIQLTAITTALIADLAVTDAKIANLAAGKITAGTITATIELLAATVTGGLIRTAAAGQRVEVNATYLDQVRWYSGGPHESGPFNLSSFEDGSGTIYGQMTPPVHSGAAGAITAFAELTATAAGTQFHACGDVAGGTAALIESFRGDIVFQLDGAGTVKLPSATTVGGMPWHAIAGISFQNGWTNYGLGFATAAYAIDALGVVHLRGLVKNGTVGTAIFTLPAGYQPVAEQVFAVVTGAGGVDTFGRVDVTAAGDVIASSGGNNYLSLDGITFATN